MQFKTIEQYEKYKDDKKILREIKKSQEALEKRKEYYKKQKEKYIAKQQLLIEEKTSRRLQRDQSKINQRLEKKIRKIQWKKPLKKLEEKPSINKVKKELYKAVQLLARLQEVDRYGYGKCISCWRRIKWNEGHGWHYIPRMHMATAFDLRNIHLQCPYCNNQLHWNLIEYRKNMIDQFGEDLVLELEEKKNQTKDFTLEELEALLAQTNWLIELEKKKLI